MQERLHYLGGPYKDYCGRAEYDDEARLFHGEVIGTQDVVTFQATNWDDLGRAFRESVDDYLAFCKESGQPAEKPFSGKFVTRIAPEVHKKISILAEAAGKSLNQLVCECLEQMVKTASVVCPPDDLVPMELPKPQKKAKRAAPSKRAKSRQREHA